MKPELEKFRKHIDHLDLTEEQKTEYIELIWMVMESYMDHVFGFDETQQSPAAQLGIDWKQFESAEETDSTPGINDEKSSDPCELP